MAKCVCKPRLTKRFELQVSTETRNSYGESEKTWAAEKSVWGEIEPLNGQERVVAMQTEGSITHRIRLRYDASITAAKRLKYGTRIFNLLPPLNVMEADRELIVLAQETL